MKIFIAGCARSGTSLTLRLMSAFEETFVWPEEAPAAKFAELDGRGKNIVVKRTAGSYKRLHELSPDISLLYCVRHPYDVLTSSHSQTVHLRRFHTTPQRWSEEYEALYRLRRAQPLRNLLISRYEDLIARPDAVQEIFARQFGLKSARRFSEDPGNEIVASSVRKWERKPEFQAYVESLPPSFLALVSRFCTEFGYDFPARAAA